jgi:protein SCO1/2
MSTDTEINRTQVLIVLAFALAFSGACILAGIMFDRMLRADLTPSGTATIGGPFTLVSSSGQNVSERSYRSKWVLIYFGYTYCPDACPTALSNISVALEKLGAGARNLQPLFVTVDPQRDTREAMANYLKSFDSRIIGLTGTQDQIDRTVKEFRVFASREKSDDGGDSYLISHTSYIYLMDPQGDFVNVIQGGATGDEIAAWLRKEMGHSGT